MNFKITKSPGTPRDQAPTARSTDGVAKPTAAGEGMTDADKRRLEFVLSRISAIYDELDEAERKFTDAAKATPKQKPTVSAKPEPTVSAKPEPEPEPEPRGMRSAVRVAAGQINVTEALRAGAKK